MNATALLLPDRACKPRRRGLTMVIDGGVPLRALQDLVTSAGEYLDFVKIGWGTAVVSCELDAKLDLLSRTGIDYYFGGTLFEKHVLQGRFDDFRSLCNQHGCRYVEISNGSIEMSNEEKAGYITKMAEEFTVISEVGFKEGTRSERLSPKRWIEYIHQDLHAGAELVTLESRESGRSRICRSDGQLRVGLIEEVLDAGVSVDLIMFEAPTTALQAYFVNRIGSDVNLGNIAPSGLITLETLRLGLRADTLSTFEEQALGKVSPSP